MELSEKSIRAVKNARNDLRKGRTFTSGQVRTRLEL